jgi:hypothetical protein
MWPLSSLQLPFYLHTNLISRLQAQFHIAGTRASFITQSGHHLTLLYREGMQQWLQNLLKDPQLVESTITSSVSCETHTHQQAQQRAGLAR